MFKLNTLSLLVMTTCGGVAYANSPADLPQGGNVVVGTATINTNADKMTIDQSTNKVQINWDSFDIGKNKEVEFKQPGDMSVAYNRVVGGNASQIQGKLTSNGKVYLANPNGILITKGAEVNVGGLLATTKDLDKISTADGAADKFSRSKKVAKEGQILNQGKITAKGERAFVALVGDDVKNEGEIIAENFYKVEEGVEYACYPSYYWWEDDVCGNYPYRREKSTTGDVYLGAGDSFNFTLKGGYIDVELDANTVKGIVQNDGAINVNGDLVLNAKGTDAALDSLVINNNVLQATQVRGKNSSGKIVLSAGEITLNEKSNIKAEAVDLGENSYWAPKPKIKVVSKEGSKITTPTLNIEGKTVDLRGKIGREDSTDHYSDEHQTLKTTVNIKTTDEIIHTANSRTNETDSFVQTDTLASLLANNGKVNMTAKGFEFSGDINLESFKNTDSVLKLNTANEINMNNLNINAKDRLFIIGLLENDRYNPNQVSNISIKNSHLNLGNGAIGLGRGSGGYSIMIDDKLNPFNLIMDNVKLNKVDDFVVTGGFTKVDINNLNGDGQTNYYINAGNTRPHPYTKQLKYEYGVKDLEERTQRSNLNQAVRRWKYSSNLDIYIDHEYNHYYEMYSARTNNRELIPNTEVNIKNSRLNLTNGFVHLLAEKINLDNTNIDIAFNNGSATDLSTQINRVGLHGKTTMTNSNIKVVGDERGGISPVAPYAGMYVLGSIEGENSSIFVKTHQGYSFRADNATLSGKNSKDDLKITAINTGGRAGREIIGPDGLPMSEDNDANASNVAFDAGDSAYTRVTINNATVTALAPNGGVAYTSMEDRTGTGIDVNPNASFTFFELPRNQKFLQMAVEGDTTKLNYRSFARLYDGINGIKASSLSERQLNVSDTEKKTLKNDPSDKIEVENIVAMTVCDEKNRCEERLLGNKNTNATVSVGTIQSE